jgi:D-alanine-D-alanine ligase
MADFQIGVVFGGRSPEHEVSIVSALQVINFLSERHNVIPIYITEDGRWITGNSLKSVETYKNFNINGADLQTIIVTPDTKIKTIKNPMGKGFLKKPEQLELDVVFPVLHGLNGEDGTIQGLLELADIPYVGPDYIASAICIDKVVTKLVLKGAGLPVLDWISFSRLDWETNENTIVEVIEKKFEYPIVIKPAKLGSSIGIAVANDIDELKFNISVASHFDSKILVEPCITNKLEINCSVLGYQNPRPSLCEQPLSSGKFLSFEEKYLQGSNTQGMEGAKRIIPAPISAEFTEKIQKLAVGAFSAVGARGIIRIDFISDLNTNSLFINEINTIPGSLAYYLWEPSGLSPENLVDELIDIAFESSREKKRSNYSPGPSVLQKLDFLRLRKD